MTSRTPTNPFPAAPPPPPPPDLVARWGKAMGAVALGLAAAGVAWFMSTHPGGVAPEAAAIAPYTLPLDAGVPVDAEIAFYGKRVAKDPGLFVEQNILAAAYLRKARETSDPAWYERAATAAAASLKAMPKGNPDAELVRAHLALARHDFPAARTIADRVAKEAPRAGADAVLAAIDLAQGKPQNAAARLEAVVSRAPSTANLSTLGLARAAMGDDEGAIGAWTKAVKTEQAGDRAASADARTWLARQHLRRGRLPEAALLLTHALHIDPRHGQALGLMGDLAARQGKLDDADDFWRRAGAVRHDLGPELARARIAKADGRDADAEALWEVAERELRADLAHGILDHRRDLARLLLDRGRASDAAEAERLLAAERTRREDAETLDLHAGALLALGRLPEAWAASQQARATGAREAPCLHRAALIARAQGDEPRADELFRTAELVDPTFKDDPACAALDPTKRW